MFLETEPPSNPEWFRQPPVLILTATCRWIVIASRSFSISPPVSSTEWEISRPGRWPPSHSGKLSQRLLTESMNGTEISKSPIHYGQRLRLRAFT